MKKITIFITTYNRPDLLLLLLNDIDRERTGYLINLVIINDHSAKDYSQVLQLLEEKFHDAYRYIINEENLGKSYFWKTINKAYNLMAGESFDYFIQLQDDVRLVKGFFKKVTDSYDAITDSRKVCMNILVDYSRFMKPCWTSVLPQACTFGQYDLIKTGWTDMFFIAGQLFFKILNYRLDPVDLRFTADKEHSSGVGMQISRRLIAMNYSIYSLKRSLVIHNHHASVMHPDHRKRVPLITNHDMSKITATMATFPGREYCLVETIRSIIDQVDELNIYANNLHETQIKLHIPPIYLHHKKIKWYYSDHHLGDLGDAGKFYQVEKIKGYHFTIDDDIIYPPDYVITLINAIEVNQRKAIVSLHGRIMPPHKVQSYYKNALQQFSCLRNLNQDSAAHIVGTGVMAYHTDTLRIPFKVFEAINMADIWFSKYCNENNIPRLILQHRAGWIRESAHVDHCGTIYTQNVNDCQLQTEICNSVNWTL